MRNLSAALLLTLSACGSGVSASTTEAQGGAADADPVGAAGSDPTGGSLMAVASSGGHASSGGTGTGGIGAGGSPASYGGSQAALGGSATGGLSATGGMLTGGKASGGAATGGQRTGGAKTGGVGTGGDGTGGNPPGCTAGCSCFTDLPCPYLGDTCVYVGLQFVYRCTCDGKVWGECAPII